MPPVTTNPTVQEYLARRSTVRRQLFQDEETSQRDNDINSVNELLLQSNEEAKRKWNFDFENEVPLEGDWQWEKIETNRQIDSTAKKDNDRSND